MHPAKREIKFRDEGKVRGFLIDSILSRNRELSSNLEIVQKEIKLERDQILEDWFLKWILLLLKSIKKWKIRIKIRNSCKLRIFLFPERTKSSEIDRNISDSDENSNQLQRVGKRDDMAE